MNNYVWTDQLSVGNLVLDQHHQNLVGLFNDAYEVLIQMKPSTQISKILSELSTYAIFHFREEERLMALAHYDDFDAHVIEHKKYIAKVTEFKENLLNKPENLNEEIFLFLYDWLINHIEQSDKKYTEALIRYTKTSK